LTVKQIARIVFLALLALVASACASAETTPAPTVEHERTPSDITLVANTGRPQFLDSYADWCITCNRNKPIVHRLEDQYKDRVDFMYLNIDLEDTLTTRERFDIVARSQYVLIDADGSVVQKWFGYLDEAEVTAALDQFLTAQ
jgi:thiol:disulfide interchange protein